MNVFKVAIYRKGLKGEVYKRVLLGFAIKRARCAKDAERSVKRDIVCDGMVIGTLKQINAQNRKVGY
jgi:hypothetical protein